MSGWALSRSATETLDPNSGLAITRSNKFWGDPKNVAGPGAGDRTSGVAAGGIFLEVRIGARPPAPEPESPEGDSSKDWAVLSSLIILRAYSGSTPHSSASAEISSTMMSTLSTIIAARVGGRPVGFQVV